MASMYIQPADAESKAARVKTAAGRVSEAIARLQIELSRFAWALGEYNDHVASEEDPLAEYQAASNEFHYAETTVAADVALAALRANLGGQHYID